MGWKGRIVSESESNYVAVVRTLTSVNVRTSTKWEEKMTRKYIAVSLVTVSRMVRVFESQRWVFKALIRMRTTKNATKSTGSRFNTGPK